MGENEARCGVRFKLKMVESGVGGAILLTDCKPELQGFCGGGGGAVIEGSGSGSGL